MKNDILGFFVYLIVSTFFSPSTGLILLAIKENSDRCHYYKGKWCIKDIVTGTVAISIGIIIRTVFPCVKMI